MSNATLTKSDLQALVRAAEKAVKETPRPGRPPSGEVPSVRGIPPEILASLVSPIVVALVVGVAKEVSGYFAKGTIKTMEILIGSVLKKKPNLKTASDKVEQVLKDLDFPPESRLRIIKQIVAQAEKISKKAETAGNKARV